MRKRTTPLKPVPKGGSGREISGTGSTQFTNAEQIKNRFLAFASSKRSENWSFSEKAAEEKWGSANLP